MDQTTVQALFRKFAAPLAGFAAMSPERRELAEMPIDNLWKAMIAGPEMEDETWIAPKAAGKLNDESLQVIKQMYFNQMKPDVSEDDRAFLRKRYQLERKKPSNESPTTFPNRSTKSRGLDAISQNLERTMRSSQNHRSGVWLSETNTPKDKL